LDAAIWAISACGQNADMEVFPANLLIEGVFGQPNGYFRNFFAEYASGGRLLFCRGSLAAFDRGCDGWFLIVESSDVAIL
jgi:hypothetical protein